jgi:hypothetical protein
MKKKSTRRRKAITETRLRQIIYEELVDRYLIEEGLWDDVKSGAQKLSAYVTKQFKQVAAQWAKAIVQAVGQLKEIPEPVKKVMQVIKAAMQQSGESFQLDQGLKTAQALGKLGKDAALSVVQQDLEGPVHEKAKAAQVKGEGKYLPSIYAVLAEGDFKSPAKDSLNEALGVMTVAGLGLAVLGGLPMLFKGLHKLANVLGAHGAAEMFEKAEHVTHHFEQKTIDFVMPFKLAYLVYVGLWKMGIKLTKGDQPYNEIEIKAEEDGKKAIAQAKGLVYKVLLIYFAINGIQGVLHAGASLLGFVEGGATTIKGIELAKGAQEIAQLAKAGAGVAAV